MNRSPSDRKAQGLAVPNESVPDAVKLSNMRTANSPARWS